MAKISINKNFAKGTTVMKESLIQRCTLFVENRDAIRAAFRWENTYMPPICAAITASRGRRADVNSMRDCLDLLKQKTGLFSNFRGIAKMTFVTVLSLSPQPEEQLERMLTVYDSLKELFFGSVYLTLAAQVIAEMAEPPQYGQIAQRTRMIYNRMKSAHPFLTSGEDSAFAALLALSGLDDIYIEQEMERCYRLLKPSFFSGNAVQSLSQVLALGEGSAQQKCEKAMQIYDTLKNRGYKYGTSYELATLGVLALLDAESGILSEDMMQADDFLRGQKGFGAFGIGSRQRLMYAGMLAVGEYVPETRTIQTAALSGIVSLVIAQQAAICAAVASMTAASAASSGASS